MQVSQHCLICLSPVKPERCCMVRTKTNAIADVVRFVTIGPEDDPQCKCDEKYCGKSISEEFHRFRMLNVPQSGIECRILNAEYGMLNATFYILYSTFYNTKSAEPSITNIIATVCTAISRRENVSFKTRGANLVRSTMKRVIKAYCTPTSAFTSVTLPTAIASWMRTTPTTPRTLLLTIISMPLTPRNAAFSPSAFFTR